MDKNYKIYKLRAMTEKQLADSLAKFKEELYQLRTS
jgi:ribosomal protein L29